MLYFFMVAFIDITVAFSGIYHWYDDLHFFDVAASKWTEIISTYGNQPPARAGHGFTSAGGKLYVMGGAKIGKLAGFCCSNKLVNIQHLLNDEVLTFIVLRFLYFVSYSPMLYSNNLIILFLLFSSHQRAF
jgi:hypothetical protein